MHSMSTILFGPHSLIEYIKYKNWLWVEIRKSYRLLQLYQRELEKFLGESANSSFTSRSVDDLFRGIVCHWATIKVAKRDFEKTLHKYKCTIPSDLEMALYREYLLFGNRIMDSCEASLAKAGIDSQKLQ